MKIIIRDVTVDDAEAICDIYNPYIATTAISFEQQPVSAQDMRERITSVTAKYPWLVAESQEGVIAYAYATRWRTRAAYDHTAESAIYVRQTAQRTGAGYLLYMTLFERLRRLSVHAVVGCITVPNPGSIAFHEKCGFTKVAHFPQVGRKFDQWVDVGFWQVLLQD
jgi:L-amino acid N-acyltransferase YncA